MIRQLKRALIRSLPAEQVVRISSAKSALKRRVEAALDPDAVMETATGWDLFDAATGELMGPARAASRTRDPREREALKRALMDKAIFGLIPGDLLEEPRLRELVDDDDIYGCLVAAGRYARGDMEGAMSALELAIGAEPSSFNHLSLSRCASHGLRDDRRAVEILESALQRLPGDFALTLSLATAHYRLGETERANEHLAALGDELAQRVGASDPTISLLAAEISTALEQKLTVRPKDDRRDAYNEESSARYWEKLWCAMNGLNRFQHGWAGLDYLFQQQVGGVLADTDPGIRTVINFGVFCANPDYAVARRFPETTFYGVDREQSVKRLNERAFPAENLKFVAANIMDVLPELTGREGRSLLFHARTAVVCYPEFLRRLYRECASAGVDYIALWENNSLSRATLRFHDFGAMPADAVPYYSAMFIHDYPKLLAEAGYRVLTAERHPSDVELLKADSHLGDGHIFMVARRER